MLELSYDEFGQLSMEAIRCSRLVVDTGMHAMGWTLDQAVEFMLENTAMGKHDATTEATRYVTWPGQACAYKVGERFIRKMRTFAETELKERFDCRDFYDVVLLSGAVPLDVLKDRVEEYVEKAAIVGQGASESKGEIADITEQMTFANWCKCCVVPGACRV